MSNEKVVESLNNQVANWTVLFTKLHNFHWYVKGPNFFSLHTKFEEMYNDASTYVDDFAERILAIGGHPIATLKEYLEISIIDEAVKDYSAAEMVKELAEDLNKISDQLDEAINISGDAADDVTQDMFIGMQTDIEKNIWMLNSYLDK